MQIHEFGSILPSAQFIFLPPLLYLLCVPYSAFLKQPETVPMVLVALRDDTASAQQVKWIWHFAPSKV